jgi:hypothetical protein
LAYRALGVVGERNGFRMEGVKSGPIAPSPLFHGTGLGLKKFGCCALGWVNSSIAEEDPDDFDWRVAEITSALDAGRCNR